MSGQQQQQHQQQQQQQPLQLPQPLLQQQHPHQAQSQQPQPLRCDECSGLSSETTGMKSPYKDSPVVPHKNKSRNEKFHKVFKDIPADEVVLKSYSCAYFGDILLQGFLYLTQNYFCFYSRILVHEKQIIIPVSSVLKITREKTAFIIPNAVGILSNEDKYVFGSLMSRDNTYKKLVAIWKHLNGEADDKADTEPDISEYNGEVDGSHSGAENNNTLPSPKSGELTPNTPFEDSEDQSECSICIQCGKELDHDDDNHFCDLPTPSPVNPRGESISRTSSVSGQALSPGGQQGSAPSPTTSGSVHRRHHQHAKSNSTASTPSSPSVGQQCTGTLNQKQSKRTLTALMYRVKGMHKSSLLLLVCVTLLGFLILSAAVLGYKILTLQAQLDGTMGWIDPETSRYFYNQKVYSDMYYLNNRYHTATIQKFHSILEANIQILDEVHASLKSLQDSPVLRNSCSLAGETDGS